MIHLIKAATKIKKYIKAYAPIRIKGTRPKGRIHSQSVLPFFLDFIFNKKVVLSYIKIFSTP